MTSSDIVIQLKRLRTQDFAIWHEVSCSMLVAPTIDSHAIARSNLYIDAPPKERYLSQHSGPEMSGVL